MVRDSATVVITHTVGVMFEGGGGIVRVKVRARRRFERQYWHTLTFSQIGKIKKLKVYFLDELGEEAFVREFSHTPMWDRYLLAGYGGDEYGVGGRVHFGKYEEDGEVR